MIRSRSTSATVLDPSTRAVIPAFQPHRPMLSLRTDDAPVWTLGHDVMGPLMHAFAGWVKDEAEALAKRAGTPVRTLFVLRGGHLSQQMFDDAYPDRSDERSGG